MQNFPRTFVTLLPDHGEPRIDWAALTFGIEFKAVHATVQVGIITQELGEFFHHAGNGVQRTEEGEVLFAANSVLYHIRCHGGQECQVCVVQIGDSRNITCGNSIGPGAEVEGDGAISH